MGLPIVEGDCVVGEFWTTMSKPGEQATLIGCFIAQLDAETGRCRHFRQYWDEVPGHVTHTRDGASNIAPGTPHTPRACCSR